MRSSSEVHGSDHFGSCKVDSIAPSPGDEQAILKGIWVSKVGRDNHGKTGGVQKKLREKMVFFHRVMFYNWEESWLGN